MSPAPALALLPNPALAEAFSCHAAPVREPLPRLVHRMLELFDTGRTVAEVCAEVQIPESKGLAIVRKLSQLGIVEPRRDARLATSLSAFERGDTLRDLPSVLARTNFTADEEAFFDSEVSQPVDEELPATFGEKVSLFVSDLVLRLRGAAL